MQGIFYEDFKNAYIPEILKELYRERIYHEYIEQSGRNNLTIMDAGCNIGLFTQYVYPFAQKIYSIEPSSSHLKTLDYMLDFNKMKDKVTVIGKALSHENGTAEFHLPDNATMNSLKGEVGGKTEKVETITMEKLFKDYDIKHVDFLKLDVEGVECEIIGSPSFASVADRIDSLVVEWHTWSGRNPKQIDTTLRDLGFKTKIIPADATLIGAARV